MRWLKRIFQILFIESFSFNLPQECTILAIFCVLKFYKMASPKMLITVRWTWDIVGSLCILKPRWIELLVKGVQRNRVEKSISGEKIAEVESKQKRCVPKPRQLVLEQKQLHDAAKLEGDGVKWSVFLKNENALIFERLDEQSCL